jgi:hypothetical protein
VANYAVVLRQAGTGCSYTIDCGTRVEHLKATNLDEATREARALLCGDPERGGENWLLDHNSFAGDLRPALASAKIVSIEAELPIGEWFAEYVTQEKARQAAAQEAAELAEFERLKAKLGK